MLTFIRLPCVSQLIQKYSTSEQFVRREIILAASINGAHDWLRELKELYQTMDSWQKIAFLYSLNGFPRDEKKHFINQQKFGRVFELSLSRWAKNA